MEKIIKITGFTNAEKKDKSGTYPCFDILLNGEKKKIGVFEDEVVTALKSRIDKWVKIELAERHNGFINITGFIADAKPEEIPSSADSGLPTASQEEPTPKQAVPSEPSLERMHSEIIHKIIDDRPIFKMEVGNIGCRITAKGKTVEECRENAQTLLLAARAMMAKADSDEPEKKA